MPTILEVINKTVPYFETRGVESPRLTIELLLAHLLRVKRLQLYLDFERELDQATLDQLREMVRRRADGEPVQYVTGLAHFCGLEFQVDRRVLIPRPETELLVETVIEELRSALNTEPRTPTTLVDVGTGSGCIAVALAQRLPVAEICALDSSTDALTLAAANAQRHQVEKRIRFFQSDLLTDLPVSVRADGIVSNPPYIAEGELATLPKEVRDFEPVTALAAGEDGLKVYQRLATTAGPVLKPTGWIALELGAGQRPAVQRLFEEQGFAVVRVVKDLQGHERVMVLRRGSVKVPMNE